MKIERNTVGNVTILAFTGEFDAFNLPTVSEKIDALIRTGCTKLVFNLRRLTFINSSALGYLRKTHKWLRELEGELILSDPSNFFQTAIKTLGIGPIFKVFPDDTEAVRYFQNAGGTVLAFTGEFDAFNLPTIDKKIDAHIRTGCTHLVLNLRRLTFINSSALGYLIKTHKRLRQRGGELVLSEPSKFFQTTIKTLGIDQIFKIYRNDNEALKYLQDAGGEQAGAFEGVPVDDKLLGSTTMFFRLLDAPETMAVGKILSIYEDGPTFKYPADPDKRKIDPDELIIGRSLWIRFRQPFLEKERFFEMEAEIVMAVDLDDAEGAAKFRLRYTKVDPTDKAVLAQFIRDQDDRDDDGGGAGVPARLLPRRPSGSGAASPPPPEATA